MAVERFSLGLEDAEMESPQAQEEEPVHDALMTPTGTLGVLLFSFFSLLVFHVSGFMLVALTAHSHTF